jgi:hypothetical protein
VLTCTAEPTCLVKENFLAYNLRPFDLLAKTRQQPPGPSSRPLILRVTLSSSIHSSLSLPTQSRKFDLFDLQFQGTPTLHCSTKSCRLFSSIHLLLCIH